MAAPPTSVPQVRYVRWMYSSLVARTVQKMRTNARQWRGSVAWIALAAVIAVVLPLDVGLSSPWTVPFAVRAGFGIAIAIAIAGVGWIGAIWAATAAFLIVIAQMAVAPTVSFGHFLALVAASYAAGRLPNRTQAIVGLTLSVITTFLIGLAVDDPEFEFVFPLFVFTTAWVLGRVVHAHNSRAELLRNLAEQLDRQQAELTQLAALEERQRIAGEMHDVLANTLSSIVVQAAAARELVGERPELLTVLTNIEEVGRSGLVDVRSLLRGLDERSAGGAGATPGVGDIESLAERMRIAGLDLTVEIDDGAKDVQTSVGLNAYRIVQEALTNALRHGGAVAASVAVRRDRDALRITVSNALPAAASAMAPSGGRGLTGMGQRAAMHRGDLQAGEGRDGFYVVRAVLRLDES